MPLFILPRQDCEAKFPEIGLLIHCPDFPWPHRICKVPYDIPQQQKGYAGSGIMPSAFGSGSGFPCIKGATGSAGPPAYRLGTRIAGVHRQSLARSRRGRRDGNGLCPRGCALLEGRETRPQTANKCRSICAWSSINSSHTTCQAGFRPQVCMRRNPKQTPHPKLLTPIGWPRLASAFRGGQEKKLHLRDCESLRWR